MAKIIKLIYTEEHISYMGDNKEPIHRVCPQLWTLNGTLIAHNDPVTKNNYFKPELIK